MPEEIGPTSRGITRGRRLTFAVMSALVALFFLSGFALFLAENGSNPRCRSYFDALWLNLVFFLNGFEDFGPITTAGKAISFLMFVTGTGAMVGLTGMIASIFVQYRLKEPTMPKDTTGQIVICHWNEKGDRVIKELHAPQAAPDTDILVISNKPINEEELRSSPAYEKVFFVRSDPTLHDVLHKARVHHARSIIVLADVDAPDPDATSVLITLAVRRLCEASARRPSIVVETVNHRKMQHLRDAGADEIICGTDYGLGVLAQCALHHKLSEVYHHLLSYSDATNEIYVIESDAYPTERFAGKTFLEGAQLINAHRDPHNPVILVGVRRDGKVLLNPKTNGSGEQTRLFAAFGPDDALIVIAYDPPDMMALLAS